MADSLFYLISAETRSSPCKSQVNLDLAYLAIHSSLLHPFLFLRRLGLILPLEPGHKAGLVNIPERSNAAARRNEDVSDVLDLLKAYSAFLARVLQLQARAVLEALEGRDVVMGVLAGLSSGGLCAFYF